MSATEERTSGMTVSREVSETVTMGDQELTITASVSYNADGGEAGATLTIGGFIARGEVLPMLLALEEQVRVLRGGIGVIGDEVDAA